MTLRSDVTKRLKLSFTLIPLTTYLSSLLLFPSQLKAGPFFSDYSLSSGYSYAREITSSPGSNGSMWYIQNGPNGNSIGNISANGSITNYALTIPGYTSVSTSFITTDPNGVVWFNACYYTSTSGGLALGKLDPTTGTISLTSYSGSACSPPVAPGPIGVDSTGNIWVIKDDNNGGYSSIMKFSSTGTYLGFWTHYVSGGDNWKHMAAGANNTLWVTDGDNQNHVDKLVLSTTGGTINSITSYSVPTTSSGLGDITLGSDGNMWFNEANAAKVGKIALDGTITEYSLPTGSNPIDITAGSDGALWYTDYNNNKIGRITTSGGITSYTTPVTNGHPYSITSGSDGALWFTEYSSHKIMRLGY